MNEPDFGLDLSCPDGDLDPHGATVNGWVALAQALVRRLDTSAGTLPGDTSGAYGRSLPDQLSSGQTEAELASESAQIRAQFLGDERITDATVKAIVTGEAIAYACRVYAFGGSLAFVVDAEGAAKLLRSGSVEVL